MAKRPPLTHFLCVPLLTQASRPQFEAASKSFRDTLCSTGKDALDPDALGRAIRPTGTIHLTLGVMSLKEQDRVNSAIQFLQDMNWQIIQQVSSNEQASPGTSTQSTQQPDERSQTNNAKPRDGAKKPSQLPTPMTITLTSLKSMKSASKTSVLYAEPIDSSNRLLALCEGLRKQFIDAGFMIEENRPLKLHATILNTLYASGKGRKGQGKRKNPDLIDATEIIARFQDFVWAEEVQLEKVAICEMGAQKVEDEKGEVVDEHYKEIASRQLPA